MEGVIASEGMVCYTVVFDLGAYFGRWKSRGPLLVSFKFKDEKLIA